MKIINQKIKGVWKPFKKCSFAGKRWHFSKKIGRNSAIVHHYISPESESETEKIRERAHDGLERFSVFNGATRVTGKKLFYTEFHISQICFIVISGS